MRARQVHCLNGVPPGALEAAPPSMAVAPSVAGMAVAPQSGVVVMAGNGGVVQNGPITANQLSAAVGGGGQLGLNQVRPATARVSTCAFCVSSLIEKTTFFHRIPPVSSPL